MNGVLLLVRVTPDGVYIGFPIYIVIADASHRCLYGNNPADVSLWNMQINPLILKIKSINLGKRDAHTYMAYHLRSFNLYHSFLLSLLTSFHQSTFLPTPMSSPFHLSHSSSSSSSLHFSPFMHLIITQAAHY